MPSGGACVRASAGCGMRSLSRSRAAVADRRSMLARHRHARGAPTTPIAPPSLSAPSRCVCARTCVIDVLRSLRNGCMPSQAAHGRGDCHRQERGRPSARSHSPATLPSLHCSSGRSTAQSVGRWSASSWRRCWCVSTAGTGPCPAVCYAMLCYAGRGCRLCCATRMRWTRTSDGRSWPLASNRCAVRRRFRASRGTRAVAARRMRGRICRGSARSCRGCQWRQHRAVR